MSIERSSAGVNKSFWLFTVIDRMIIFDLFKTVSAVLSVLVFIIVSQKFIRVLAQAIEGSVSNETVLNLIGLKVILVTSAFLPTALFMAILMVLGRMYREQEMSAIASAGGGVWSIYRAIFWFIIPVSLFSGWLTMYAAPWAETRSQIMMQHDSDTADIRSISAGRFSEYRGGELIFYTEGTDPSGKMHHVFVQNKQGEQTGVVNAEYGRLEMLPGGLYLILEHGQRVLGIPGQQDFTIENFDEYAVLVEQKTSSLVLGSHSVSTESIWYSEKLPDIAELQDRLSGPISTLLLGFLAVPLAKISPRSGIYGSMVIAFAIYFSYSNMQRVNHSWVISGKIPEWLGYFWHDGLLFLVAIILLIRWYGFKWIINSLKGTH